MNLKQSLTALLLGFTLITTSTALAADSSHPDHVTFAGIPIGADQQTVTTTLLKRSPRPILIANTPDSLHFSKGFFFLKPASNWLFLFHNQKLYEASVDIPVADAKRGELIQSLKALILKRYGLPPAMKWEKANSLYGEENFIGMQTGGRLYTINIINTPGAALKVAYRDDVV